MEAARQPSREATDLATSSGSGVTGSARGHPADALLHQPRAWAADKLRQTDNQEESWGQSLSQTLRGVHPRILGPTAHPRARAPHTAKLHTRGLRRQAGSSRQQAPQPHPAVPSLRCFPTSKSQHPAQLCQARGWHLPQTPQEPGHRAAEEKDKGPGAAGEAPLTAPRPSEARSACPGGGASSSALAGLPPEPGGLPLSPLGSWPVREARSAHTGTHTHVSTAHTHP